MHRLSASIRFETLIAKCRVLQENSEYIIKRQKRETKTKQNIIIEMESESISMWELTSITRACLCVYVCVSFYFILFFRCVSVCVCIGLLSCTFLEGSLIRFLSYQKYFQHQCDWRYRLKNNRAMCCYCCLPVCKEHTVSPNECEMIANGHHPWNKTFPRAHFFFQHLYVAHLFMCTY